MIKPLIIISLIFSSSCLCLPIESDSTIIFYPKWKLNDVKNVKCIYNISFPLDDSGDTFKFNSEALTEIKINEVLDDGFIVLWKILDAKYDSIPVTAIDQGVRQLGKGVIGITAELKISKSGEFLDFINWTHIRDRYYELIDSLINKFKRGEILMYGSNYEGARESMRAKFSIKENVTNQHLKGILPFFDTYNRKFNVIEDQKEYLTFDNINDLVLS